MENPSTYYRKAFYFLDQLDYKRAEENFLYADQFYAENFKLTHEFHSLPEVVLSVKTEWADCLMNLGVVYEKMNDLKKAEQCYLKSNEIYSNSKAYYNLAVLYWNRDWSKVIEYLQSSLRLNPGNTQVQIYLDKAIYALHKSRGL